MLPPRGGPSLARHSARVAGGSCVCELTGRHCQQCGSGEPLGGGESGVASVVRRWCLSARLQGGPRGATKKPLPGAHQHRVRRTIGCLLLEAPPFERVRGRRGGAVARRVSRETRRPAGANLLGSGSGSGAGRPVREQCESGSPQERWDWGGFGPSLVVGGIRLWAVSLCSEDHVRTFSALSPTGSGRPAPVAYVSRKISISTGLCLTSARAISAWCFV